MLILEYRKFGQWYPLSLNDLSDLRYLLRSPSLERCASLILGKNKQALALVCKSDRKVT